MTVVWQPSQADDTRICPLDLLAHVVAFSTRTSSNPFMRPDTSTTTWPNISSSHVSLLTITHYPICTEAVTANLHYGEWNTVIKLIPAGLHWLLELRGHKSSSQHPFTPTTPQRTKESYKMVSGSRRTVGTSYPRRRGHA